jgi:Oxidoreductase family, NAD-binding Rossmann fold
MLWENVRDTGRRRLRRNAKESRGKEALVQKVRFAVVGMGIGKAQGKAIAQDPRGEVAALCDIDPKRMEAFAAELTGPVKQYTDYHEMCRDREIDAVFVGTPNPLHVPVALAAVEAGKHVLVTKPLSDSEEAARRLVEAAEAAGVVNMMSLSTRFGRDVQYLGGLAGTRAEGVGVASSARSTTLAPGACAGAGSPIGAPTSSAREAGRSGTWESTCWTRPGG